MGGIAPSAMIKSKKSGPDPDFGFFDLSFLFNSSLFAMAPPLPANTQVSKRAEIFENDEQVAVDEEEVMKYNAMVGLVVGNDAESQQESNDDDDEQDDEPAQDEGYSFRLFSTSTVSKVSIKEKDEAADLNELAQAVAAQQSIEQDEDDPVWRDLVAASAIDYTTIMEQSKQPYRASAYPGRLIHIPAIDKKDDEKAKKKQRKSKKRRDFEKAVRQGKIRVQPNMRDPATPHGWPGYPGNRTPCAIISMKKPFARAPFKKGPPHHAAASHHHHGPAKSFHQRPRPQGPPRHRS
ncbi:hypothetical protein BC940DRAFT_288458 [Gongronella butleri]|nr:hypothetical protein BC940DRAFT_288458 [Gongronella butleri]